MKEDIKIGDRVLAKHLFGGIFHAHIIGIKSGFLFDRYYATWMVNDLDSGCRYEVSNVLHKWNIICKN